MYRDLSEKTESIATQKADYYAGLFDNELELILLKLSTGETVAPTMTSIPLYRA